MAERAGGQAQVELIFVLPLLAALAVIALQLMAFGYAQSLADGSAEAGAVAIAAGRPPAAAARAALPGWAGSRVDVVIDGARVEVELRPPVLVPGLAGRLTARSAAWIGPAGDDG